MFVMGTCEIQFIAYCQLIRNRLNSLNEAISRCINAKNIRMKNIIFRGKIKSKQLSFIYAGSSMSTNFRKYIRLHAMNTQLLPALMQRGKTSPVVESNNYNATESYGTMEDTIVKIQEIYMRLERVCRSINNIYGFPILCIIVIKFTTLTALLYFCCMIIIKLSNIISFCYKFFVMYICDCFGIE